MNFRVWGIALIFSLLVALHATSWGVPARWNGAVYQNSVEQMVANDLHPSQVNPRIFPEFSKGQWLEGFVQICILWLSGTAGIFKILGIAPTSTALTLELTIGMSVFGWALYRLMRDRFAVSEDLATGGMLAALALIPVTILYPVRAHPEPWVMAFTVGMAHAAMGGHLVRFGLFLFLGLLSKQSIVPAVGIVLVGDLLSTERPPREWLRWLGVTFGVFVAHQGVMHWLAWPVELRSGDLLFTDQMQKLNQRLNGGRNWDYFLRNFDLIWIPFSLAMVTATRQVRAYAALSMGASFALLLIASDWWRNLYASLVWLVVPVGVAFVDREIWPRLSALEKALFTGGCLLSFFRRFDVLRMPSMSFSFCVCAAYLLWVLTRQDTRLRS